MSKVSYSFQPDGKYFLFCTETGRTIARDFDSPVAIKQYMIWRMYNIKGVEFQ